MAIVHASQESLGALTRDGFVIVDFYGTTCAPCKMLARVLEDLEAEMPFVNIVKLNTTDYPAAAKEYGVTGIPDIRFLRDGEVVEKHLGLMTLPQLKEVIARHLYA